MQKSGGNRVSETIGFDNCALSGIEIKAIENIFSYYEEKTRKYNKRRVFMGNDCC